MLAKHPDDFPEYVEAARSKVIQLGIEISKETRKHVQTGLYSYIWRLLYWFRHNTTYYSFPNNIALKK